MKLCRRKKLVPEREKEKHLPSEGLVVAFAD